MLVCTCTSSSEHQKIHRHSRRQRQSFLLYPVHSHAKVCAPGSWPSRCGAAGPVAPHYAALPNGAVVCAARKLGTGGNRGTPVSGHNKEIVALRARPRQRRYHEQHKRCCRWPDAYAMVMTSVCARACPKYFGGRRAWPERGSRPSHPTKARRTLQPPCYLSLLAHIAAAIACRIPAYQATMCYTCSSRANTVYSMRTAASQFGTAPGRQRADRSSRRPAADRRGTTLVGGTGQLAQP